MRRGSLKVNAPDAVCGFGRSCTPLGRRTITCSGRLTRVDAISQLVEIQEDGIQESEEARSCVL